MKSVINFLSDGQVREGVRRFRDGLVHYHVYKMKRQNTEGSTVFRLRHNLNCCKNLIVLGFLVSRQL